ncbi:hypothetical protein FKP32DRAFT_1678150 [Trametes sanguinea]|nr:hypothetical protein FKP32DRAFT_1678150 [Trametes sanguinea]
MSTTKNTRPSPATVSRPAKRQRKDVSGGVSFIHDSDATIPSDQGSSPEAKDGVMPEDKTVAVSSNSAVGTANPSSTEAARLPVSTFPEWVSDDVKRRLLDFMTFSEPSTNRYAVARVPSSAKWGDNSAGTDYSRYLCHNDKPVVVWLVGTVVSKWFHNRMGDPQDKVNVAITPLREEDMQAIATLLSKSCPPKPFKGDKVYAGRMMAEWVKGEEKPRIGSFLNIFDATNGFGRKSTMKRKHAHDIGVGDIVLVETAMTRYKTGTTKYTWERWNTSFELRAISLLAELPVGQSFAEADDFDDDGDTTL